MQAHSSKRSRLLANLQTTPLLQRLERASLEQLAHRAVQQSYAPGTVLFLEGDPAPALYYIDAGWVKVAKISPDGREQILSIWGAGELFGGIVSMFGNRPAPATAVALEATDAWLFPPEALHEIVAANPALMLHIVEFMADRMSELLELVADLSLHTVSARLARLLLEQADDGLIQRHRWATQTEMASRLGTVSDVLNRALRSLVEEGLIELTRNHIRILNYPGLTAKALPIR